LESRHRVGVDTICWECDYPHSDSTWPMSAETLAKSLNPLDDLTRAEVDAITHGNAMRHFRYDPFAHRQRESCTVGALRAEASDNAPDSAMEKQPAWAAAMSSSGLVPVPLSKRDANEYCPSKAPPPNRIVPFPDGRSPSHCASEVRTGILLSP